MKHPWLNLIGFQLVWFGAVGGAAAGWWWAGPLVLVAFAAVQLGTGPRAASDLRLMLACALVGTAVDSAWVQLGWMHFASPVPWPGLAPVWIVAMWMGFALTLDHSLAPLQRRPWLGAVLGGVGGPLAYWGAERAWGAVTIDDAVAAYLGLAVTWAVLTPALLQLATVLRPRALAVAS